MPEEASIVVPWSAARGRLLLYTGISRLVLPVRLAAPLDFLLALVFSCMRMVIVSPTQRARLSANSASLAVSGWKIAPVWP